VRAKAFQSEAEERPMQARRARQRRHGSVRQASRAREVFEKQKLFETPKKLCFFERKLGERGSVGTAAHGGAK